MAAKLFSNAASWLTQRGPIVTRRAFAAVLRKLREHSRISIAGYACRRTATGLVFTAEAGGHPWQVTMAGEGLVEVTPGVLVLAGTAQTFILGGPVGVAGSGYVVVTARLRNVISEGVPDPFEPSVFTGEIEADVTAVGLEWVTGPPSPAYSEPDFSTGECDFTSISIPLAWVDTAAGEIVQYVRSSLAVGLAIGDGGALQPDVTFHEI